MLYREGNDHCRDMAVGINILNAYRVVLIEEFRDLVFRKVLGDILDEDEVLVRARPVSRHCNGCLAQVVNRWLGFDVCDGTIRVRCQSRQQAPAKARREGEMCLCEVR
jgi:hypothetical protein